MIPSVQTRSLAGITLRQKLILACLLDATGPVALEEIALEVGASVRTLRRDLQAIEALLQACDLSLDKRTGRGLCLTGPGDRASLREAMSAVASAALRPADRQSWLACRLLASTGPLKLASLAVSLRIAVATVVSDLEALNSWFSAYVLLIRRKRGWGVAIEGEEINLRNAAIDLFFEQFEEATLQTLFEQPPEALDPGAVFLRPAWLLISPASFRRAGEILGRLGSRNVPQGTTDRVEFGLHLALLLERTGAGRSGRALCTLGQSTDAEGSDVGALLSRALPASEVDRLGRLLHALTMPCTKPTPELTTLAVHFIDECEGLFGQTLSGDAALLEGIAVHLSRALRRLRNQFTIRNPLLNEIREQYPRLFASARAAADRVFTRVRLPDTEIGFLVLHLGSSLLRRRRRLLVVCPTGLGTSKMLSARLRGELPDAEVVGVLPVSEISSVDPTSYDLILSTVALDLPGDLYLVVSPLLPPRDVSRIVAAFGKSEVRGGLRLPDVFVAAAGANTL